MLIFSQWTKVLDILDYYLAEKNFEVCRIDGSVKLAERKRQVLNHSFRLNPSQNQGCAFAFSDGNSFSLL